ncbi:hypothetical protein BOX15_Mlig023111g1 [Macrostomum lignano]|uniref:CRAL-TRIO domain-containing protein n=1 Tax=Macrostomum lignano TaxID=282301 RepID=A0A267E9H4_9PLAT|nr:hypothetical protein BOX15_Mlig023111g1 [Macrostomum lignano]
MASGEGENVYNYEGVDPKDKKKAQKELHENPDQVRAHIASLRRWVTSAPHLTCPTDDAFLLRFLRTAKFDQSRAQQLVDNFCTVRKSPRGSPEWFEPLPLDSPIIEEALKLPMNIFLGYNDDGEGIIYSSMDNYDPDRINFNDLARFAYMNADTMMKPEKIQINGCRFIMNLKNANKKQTQAWENPRTAFKMMRNWQDAFPMRTKALVYWHEPAFFELMFRIIMPFMKEKLRKRLHRCGTDFNKLKKAIGPGAERLLPPEMGGQNRPMEELLAERYKMFKSAEAQAERAKLATITVDESKRLPTTKDYLKTYDDSADPSMGIAGTFTKLDVS